MKIKIHQSETCEADTHVPCSGCGYTIRPGETYKRGYFIWNGRRQYLRNCNHCTESEKKP